MKPIALCCHGKPVRELDNCLACAADWARARLNMGARAPIPGDIVRSADGGSFEVTAVDYSVRTLKAGQAYRWEDVEGFDPPLSFVVAEAPVAEPEGT